MNATVFEIRWGRLAEGNHLKHLGIFVRVTSATDVFLFKTRDMCGDFFLESCTEAMSITFAASVH